jgi:tetratricopeptide (TPR) repeat protein
MGLSLRRTFDTRPKNMSPSFFVRWLWLGCLSLLLVGQVAQSVELNRVALALARQLGGRTLLVELFPKTLTRAEVSCVTLTLPTQTELTPLTTGLPSLPNTLRLKSLLGFYSGGSTFALEAWLNTAPTNPFARFLYGVQRTKTLNCINLRTYFKDTPSAAHLFFLLGEVAQTRGQIPTALAYHQIAFSLAPDHLPTINTLIYLYAMTRDKTGEAQMIEKYLTFRLADQLSLPYKMRQGRLYELRSQWAEALQMYQETCRAFPQVAECHYRAGELYRTLFKESAKAQQEFEAAIQADPTYSLAWGSLNFLLLSHNKTAEVTALLNRMRQELPSSELPDFYAGWDALLVNQPREAIPYLQKALARNAQNSAAHDLLGQAYQATGEVPLAVTSFRQALTLNPHSAQIAAQLGAALEQVGQPVEACDWVQYALNLEASNPLALTTRAKLKECS